MASVTTTEPLQTEPDAPSAGVVAGCEAGLPVPVPRGQAGGLLGRARQALARLSRMGREAAGPLYGTPIGGPPPAPAGGDYAFAFLGDSRDNNGVLAQTVDGAARQGCAFAVHAGDLTAHGGAGSYRSFVGTVLKAAAGRLPVYPVLGNHDRNSGILGGKRKSNYRRFFGEPSYTAAYGGDAFVVVDSSGKEFTAEDAAALEPVLASARRRARHLFVIGHTPPVDPRSGAHHCLRPADAARFLGLMRRHGVTMALSSHIHGFWQRVADGVPLLISGGAGSRLVAGQRHHWVRVAVSDRGVTTQEVPVGRE